MAESRPSYRKPWTFGAYAYPQADSLEAMVEGTKRCRKPLTVHVAHAGLVGEKCAGCGVAFDAEYTAAGMTGTTRDELGYAYVDYDPRTKRAVARHYYCAWARTMGEVLDLARRM